MAVIANTVQGLNETIGLLKQILGAVKGGDKTSKGGGGDASGKGGDDKGKGVGIKDILSAGNVLSKVDKKGSENIKAVILAFEPLNKLDAKAGEKAKGIADAVKILTSDDIVKGLQKFSKLNKGSINGIMFFIREFSKGLEGVAKEVDMKTIKSFSKILEAITGVIKNIVITLYAIAGLVVVAAIVGVVAIFAWKFILIGFAAIIGVAMGIVIISKILFAVQALSEPTMISIAVTILTMYAAAGIVVVAALLGVICVLLWPFVIVGFVAIIYTVVLLVAVSMILNDVAIASEATATSIYIVAKTILLAGAVVLVAALVGVVVIEAWEYVLLGFAVMTTVFLAFWGLEHLIAKKGSNKDMTKAMKNLLWMSLVMIAIAGVISVMVAVAKYIEESGVSWQYMVGTMLGFGALCTGMFFMLKAISKLKITINHIKTVAMAAGLLVVISLVIKMLVDISITIKEKTSAGAIIAVVAMMAAVMLGTILLIKVISKIKIGVKESLIILGLIGILVILTYVIKELTNISILMKENDIGWGAFISMIGMMAVAVAAIALLMVGIGLLSANPYVAAALAIGTVVLLAIGTVAIVLTCAVKGIIEAGKMAQELGIDKIPEVAKGLAQALTSFLITICDELSLKVVAKAALIGVLVKPIGNVVNLCSDFLQMLSSFSTEDCAANELRTVHYNSETGKYVLGPKIDVVNAGKIVAEGFSKFVMGISTGLEDFKGKQKRTMKRLADSGLTDVINACSSFVNMISGMAFGTGDWLGIYETDGNGNFIKDKKGKYKIRLVNVKQSGLTVANGFTTFVKTLSDEFVGGDGRKIKRNLKKLRKAGISDIIDICNNFVEMISAFDGSGKNSKGEKLANGQLALLVKDSSGNYIKSKNGVYETKIVDLANTGKIIGKALSSFVKELSDGIKGTNTGNIETFSKHFGNITKNFEKITNSIFAIDDSKAKKLKEHTDAINKFAQAVGKVAESIDVLNGKEINLKLDEIRKGINMTIDVQNNQIDNIKVTGTESGGSGGGFLSGVKNAFSGGSGGSGGGINSAAIAKAIVDGFSKIKNIQIELDQISSKKYYEGSVSVKK